MRRFVPTFRPRPALAVGALLALAACSAPASPPEAAPTTLDVRGLGGAVELAWSAPEAAGAPDVAVQVRRAGETTWRDARLAPADAAATPAAASGRVRVTSLTDFTPLRFRAALRGAGGVGPWSSPTDVATSTAPPTRTGDAPAPGDAVDPAGGGSVVARCRADGALRLDVPAPPGAGDDPTLDCDDRDPVGPPPGLDPVRVELAAVDADARPLDVAATNGVLGVPTDGALRVAATGFAPGTAVEAWRVGGARPLALLPVGEDGVARGDVAPAGREAPGDAALWLQGRTRGGVQGVEVGYRIVSPTSDARLLSVDVAPESLTLDVGTTVTPSVTTVFVGEGGDALTWTSDDPGVVTVDAAGALTAVAPGAATVRAAGANDPATYDEVVVRVAGATGVTLDAPTFPLGLPGGTWTLAADVTTVHGAPVGVTWSSSDPSVATVDANGVVTAVAPGDVVVSATSVAAPGLEAGTPLAVLASGEVAWTRQFGTEQDDVGYAVTVAPDGTLVLGGAFGEWEMFATAADAAASRALLAGVTPAGEVTFVTDTADPQGRFIETRDVTVVPEGLLTSNVTVSGTGGVFPEIGGSLRFVDAAGTSVGAPIPLSTSPNAAAWAIEPAGHLGLALVGSVDASTDTLTRTTAAFWSADRTNLEALATISPTTFPNAAQISETDMFAAALFDVAVDPDGGEAPLLVGAGRVVLGDEEPFFGTLTAFEADGTVRLSPTDLASGLAGADPSLRSEIARGVVQLPDGRFAVVGSAEPGSNSELLVATYDPDAPAGTSPVDAYLLGGDKDDAHPRAVAVLPTGELVIVGQSDERIGADAYTDEPPAGFVAIVDVPPSGAPTLLRTWQVGLGYDTIVHDVAVTEDGWLVLAGETQAPLDVPNAGGDDAFLQLVAP